MAPSCPAPAASRQRAADARDSVPRASAGRHLLADEVRSEFPLRAQQHLVVLIVGLERTDAGDLENQVLATLEAVAEAERDRLRDRKRQRRLRVAKIQPTRHSRARGEIEGESRREAGRETD